MLHGLIRPGAVTLLTAYWKSGKTTWLSHLLANLAPERVGNFCGLATANAPVLIITEEPADLWVEWRDRLGIGDHTRIWVRPYWRRPQLEDWIGFIGFLTSHVKEHRVKLVVIDPLPNFWPVADEKDPTLVGDALAPLRMLTEVGAAVLLVFHPRKADGAEGTATRGSGAIPAFMDIIVEMRRMCPMDRKDRRRIFTAYSRYRETPAELVIELTQDERSYNTQGDRAEAGSKRRTERVEAILPGEPPGLTVEEILDNWPEDDKPSKRSLELTLREGVESSRCSRTGQGKKGDPYRYWIPKPDAEVSFRTPFDDD